MEITKRQAQVLDDMLIKLTTIINTRGSRIFGDEMAGMMGIDVDEVESYWKTFIATAKFNNMPVVDFYDHTGLYSIEKNFNTSEFISWGGFKRYVEEQEKKNAEELQRKQLEEQKLINDIASFRITKKQYVWNKIFAIAGFILGLISFLWQIFNHA